MTPMLLTLPCTLSCPELRLALFWGSVVKGIDRQLHSIKGERAKNTTTQLRGERLMHLPLLDTISIALKS